MNADVEALCRPRGRHNLDRAGYGDGPEAGSVTLGGWRVPIPRPWVRAADGSGKLPLPAYELFAGTELLGELGMERMPLRTRAGLPNARFHDLRHFTASALIRYGESVKTVAHVLGHADETETLRT
jgi:hypothetical protein